MSWLRRLDGYIARALSLLIRGYQLTLSPWLGRACRFTPSYSIGRLVNGQKTAALPSVVRRRS